MIVFLFLKSIRRRSSEESSSRRRRTETSVGISSAARHAALDHFEFRRFIVETSERTDVGAVGAARRQVVQLLSGDRAHAAETEQFRSGDDFRARFAELLSKVIAVDRLEPRADAIGVEPSVASTRSNVGEDLQKIDRQSKSFARETQRRCFSSALFQLGSGGGNPSRHLFDRRSTSLHRAFSEFQGEKNIDEPFAFSTVSFRRWFPVASR